MESFLGGMGRGRARRDAEFFLEHKDHEGDYVLMTVVLDSLSL